MRRTRGTLTPGVCAGGKGHGMRRFGICVATTLLTLAGCTSGGGGSFPAGSTNTVSRVPSPSDGEGSPSEGAAVVFNQPAGAAFAVFSIGVDGGNEQQIREIYDPAILSPDGSRLVSVVLASDG